jgi:hypothetical protein
MSRVKILRLLAGAALAGAIAMPLAGRAQTASLQFAIDNRDVGTIDPESGQVIAPLMNPCTKELVNITGTLAATSTVTTNASGIVRTSITLVANGVGMGATTGLLYSFSETQDLSMKLSGLESELDTTVKLSMKGARSLDNWSSRLKLHLTLNANGEVTSAHTHVDTDKCNG